jgi:type I restriction enzyme M protein
MGDPSEEDTGYLQTLDTTSNVQVIRIKIAGLVHVLKGVKGLKLEGDFKDSKIDLL